MATQVFRASRIMHTSQGIGIDTADSNARLFLDNPATRFAFGADGVTITPEDIAEFEAWASTLPDWEMSIACLGCDETEPNGPITYVGWNDDGTETRVIIPGNCYRVLTGIFDAMDT